MQKLIKLFVLILSFVIATNLFLPVHSQPLISVSPKIYHLSIAKDIPSKSGSSFGYFFQNNNTTTVNNNTPTVNNNTPTVNNNTSLEGIKFRYPSSWSLQVIRLEFSLRPPLPMPRFMISVSYDPHSTLDSLIRGQTISISSWAHIDKSFPITLAGNAAHEVLFSFTKGHYAEKWMQLWTVKNGRTYIISYAALTSLYSTYLPIVQKMINTVSLVK